MFHAPGTKWKLVYSLYTMRHWRQLAQGYRAVMVADDDLVMDTCVISRYCMVLRAALSSWGGCRLVHGYMYLWVGHSTVSICPLDSWQDGDPFSSATRCARTKHGILY